MKGGARRADDTATLAGTDLTPADLTENGGDWMLVLGPVTDEVSNRQVLGFTDPELLWS
jgi:hypothetical protein